MRTGLEDKLYSPYKTVQNGDGEKNVQFGDE